MKKIMTWFGRAFGWCLFASPPIMLMIAITSVYADLKVIHTIYQYSGAALIGSMGVYGTITALFVCGVTIRHKRNIPARVFFDELCGMLCIAAIFGAVSLPGLQQLIGFRIGEELSRGAYCICTLTGAIATVMLPLWIGHNILVFFDPLKIKYYSKSPCTVANEDV